MRPRSEKKSGLEAAVDSTLPPDMAANENSLASVDLNNEVHQAVFRYLRRCEGFSEAFRRQFHTFEIHPVAVERLERKMMRINQERRRRELEHLSELSNSEDEELVHNLPQNWREVRVQSSKILSNVLKQRDASEKLGREEARASETRNSEGDNKPIDPRIELPVANLRVRNSAGSSAFTPTLHTGPGGVVQSTEHTPLAEISSNPMVARTPLFDPVAAERPSGLLNRKHSPSESHREKSNDRRLKATPADEGVSSGISAVPNPASLGASAHPTSALSPEGFKVLPRKSVQLSSSEDELSLAPTPTTATVTATATATATAPSKPQTVPKSAVSQSPALHSEVEEANTPALKSKRVLRSGVKGNHAQLSSDEETPTAPVISQDSTVTPVSKTTRKSVAAASIPVAEHANPNSITHALRSHTKTAAPASALKRKHFSSDEESDTVKAVKARRRGALKLS